MVKGAVLSDKDDNVLDGCASLSLFLSLERTGERTAQGELQHYHGYETYPQIVKRS